MLAALRDDSIQTSTCQLLTATNCQLAKSSSRTTCERLKNAIHDSVRLATEMVIGSDDQVGP
jgi:hypothetical protein